MGRRGRRFTGINRMKGMYGIFCIGLLDSRFRGNDGWDAGVMAGVGDREFTLTLALSHQGRGDCLTSTSLRLPERRGLRSRETQR